MRKELPGYPVYRLKMGLPRRYAPRNDGGMDSCFRRNDPGEARLYGAGIKEKGEEIGPSPALSPRRERVRVRGICICISNWSIGKSVNR